MHQLEKVRYKFTMLPQRVWTVEEVNAILPRIEFLVTQQLERAKEIDRCWKKLQVALHSAQENASSQPTSNKIHAMEEDLQRRVRIYERGWKKIEEIGAIVKDPRVGLCDFYGRFDGNLVLFCWRFGEKSITHYHGVDEGFINRKPLTSDIRKRLLN